MYINYGEGKGARSASPLFVCFLILRVVRIETKRTRHVLYEEFSSSRKFDVRDGKYPLTSLTSFLKEWNLHVQKDFRMVVVGTTPCIRLGIDTLLLRHRSTGRQGIAARNAYIERNYHGS